MLRASRQCQRWEQRIRYLLKKLLNKGKFHTQVVDEIAYLFIYFFTYRDFEYMFYSWNKRSLITFFYYNIDFYTIFLKCKSFFVFLSFTMIKILTKIVQLGNFSLNLVKKRSYCKNQMLRLLQPLGYFIHIFQNFFYCITYLSINFHLFFLQ